MTRRDLSLDGFLKKYDFNEQEQEFVKNDFNRGEKRRRRRQTTKQILTNKKFNLSKEERSKVLSG